MTDKLFSETIFHYDRTMVNQFAYKFGNRLPATISEMAFVQQAKNGAFDYVQAYCEYFNDLYGLRQDVATIPIIGEMSRYTYWTYGNEFLIRCLEKIANNDNYIGVVIKSDSGGGTADSCNIFADAILEFKKKKPIVMQTNYSCSANYFVGSACDEIIVEPQAASRIGSLGTLIMYQNWMGYLEREGIDVEIIRAEQSPDKATINPYEEFTEDMRAELISNATAACKEFHGYVRRNRAGKIASDEVFSGKVYNASQAIKLGLADRTGTMKDAVNRVITLSKSK